MLSGSRPQRRSQQFLRVFLEYRQHLRRVGRRAAWQGLFEILKENVKATRHDRRDRPSRFASNVLERVAAAARSVDGGARGRINLLAVYFEPVFALDDIPPFLVLAMTVKRRALT